MALIESAGAVLYTEDGGVRQYGLGMEKNGSFGLPKGHVEPATRLRLGYEPYAETNQYDGQSLARLEHADAREYAHRNPGIAFLLGLGFRLLRRFRHRGGFGSCTSTLGHVCLLYTSRCV